MRPAAAACFLVCLLAATSCEESQQMLLPDPPVQTVDVASIILIDCGPPDIVEDPAEIREAAVVGDLLRLRVEYSGGCETHQFSLHAPRCFLESYPIQSDIFLAHDDADDSCDALVEQELLFDLTPLKQEYLKTYRGSDGPIILRIYPPGTRDPVEPRPRYEFTAS